MKGTIGIVERSCEIPVHFEQHETLTKYSKDYNQLENKPSIEGIILEGNIQLPEIGIRSIQYHTEAEWNAQPTLLTVEGALYIYSDHTKIIDPDTREVTVIPAIKIGDGVSYLSQIPFLGGSSSHETEKKVEILTRNVEEHVTNETIHVSDEDRNDWDSKVCARYESGNLVLF